MWLLILSQHITTLTLGWVHWCNYQVVNTRFRAYTVTYFSEGIHFGRKCHCFFIGYTWYCIFLRYWNWGFHWLWAEIIKIWNNCLKYVTLCVMTFSTILTFSWVLPVCVNLLCIFHLWVCSACDSQWVREWEGEWLSDSREKEVELHVLPRQSVRPWAK